MLPTSAIGSHAPTGWLLTAIEAIQRGEMGQDDPPLGLTRTWAETDEISVGGTLATEGGLPRGSALGRYVVLDCLGAGAMGIVFAA